MDFYLVIGNPHTRKASLVRSLTGCFNRSVRDIQLADGRGVLRVYARVGALQDTRTAPDDFVAEVARSRCQAVLCCLAPSAQAGQADLYPDAPAYLAAFKAQGWRLRSIVVLGQNGGGVRSPLLRQFPDASAAPVNLTAQAVRSHFGWV